MDTVLPQVVPGADPSTRQLCFAWGPAEVLVCETLFSRAGGSRSRCLSRSPSPSRFWGEGRAGTAARALMGSIAGTGEGAPSSSRVFVVRRDQDIYIQTLRKLFNESHGIFMGLQRSEEELAGKSRKAQ